MALREGLQMSEYLTVQEAAAILRVDPWTVRRFLREGRLPGTAVAVHLGSPQRKMKHPLTQPLEGSSVLAFVHAHPLSELPKLTVAAPGTKVGRAYLIPREVLDEVKRKALGKCKA
jgi:excisionase family DNA binding protein